MPLVRETFLAVAKGCMKKQDVDCVLRSCSVERHSFAAVPAGAAIPRSRHLDASNSPFEASMFARKFLDLEQHND
jgi:hypothetical protein